MSLSESQKSRRLTVRLVKSFGQTVDTHELEWESKLGKLIVRLVISLSSRYKWVRVGVKGRED